MAEVSFYHLERSSLESVLPKLLEKVLSAGLKAVVKLGSAERVEAINGLLWIYEQGAFLPHGSAVDGNGPEQPIWLTDGDDNPAGATVLVLADGAESSTIAGYDRCLELFDGRDETALGATRVHWKTYKEQGFSLTYLRQTPAGGWEKQDI